MDIVNSSSIATRDFSTTGLFTQSTEQESSSQSNGGTDLTTSRDFSSNTFTTQFIDTTPASLDNSTNTSDNGTSTSGPDQTTNYDVTVTDDFSQSTEDVSRVTSRSSASEEPTTADLIESTHHSSTSPVTVTSFVTQTTQKSRCFYLLCRRGVRSPSII